MLSTYRYPKFEYRKPAELGAATVRHVPVVVVGAGPVGLAGAIDLGQRDVPCVLLDEDDTVSIGSRGVCYAKRALEVLDRIGCGEAIASHGVTWNVGRTFFRDAEVYSFNLLPEPDHRRPGMVNLQQYHLEEHLVRRMGELPAVDARWRNRVVSVAERGDRVELEIQTPDGYYALTTDWLVVADGARSPIRKMFGLDVEGKVFMDRFLIADVVMKADFPAERWFWFDPPFHPGQSVLLHRQADNVWRIDFQLGWNADPEEEKRPEKVIPRIRAMLGPEREFDLEWTSVYTFQCRRMKRFRHGRLLFVGDAAHQVSPFGARGANSGIQDTDNLVWKLALVMDGKAPESLLDTYSSERVAAADENIMNSTRATDFITPKSRASMAFRNAALALAREHAFARLLVNSGRLSVPSFLADSPLNTDDADAFHGRMVPGAPMDDAPIADEAGHEWLLQVAGDRFQALVFVADPSLLARAFTEAVASLARDAIPVEVIVVAALPGKVPGARVVVDRKGLAGRRYDGQDGTTYVLRPDQHVCARARRFDLDWIRLAVRRATCND